MHAHLADRHVPYSGRELRSHWIRETFGLAGDAIAAFLGPCEVTPQDMVDLDDARAGDGIRAALMLHFIAEHFDTNLERAVLRQRLLVALACEAVRKAASSAQRDALTRRGDDLFVGERKLSVSIATASPVSTLIHLGINVDPAGAPVPAVGLAELGADATALARDIMRAYAEELAGVRAARCKVRSAP